MADESAEVKIKLVVDDQASELLEKMRGDMHDVGEETKKSEEGMKAFGNAVKTAGEGLTIVAGGAAAAAAAMGLAYEGTMKLAEAATSAADENYKQVRAMTGLGVMMDHGANSMKDIRAYSEGLHEDLEMAGVKAGVASNEMVEMYETLIKRGTMGTEKAKELTAQLAEVGKIIPGGSTALAQGFSQMEMGMVRARNPLVQLIASTQLLHGNAQAVAKQMQHMTPAKQIELAEKAIAKQAEMLKAGGTVLPPTLESIETSFKGMREMMLESIGNPILEHLVPALGKARDYLAAHMETIEDFATTIGNSMGEFVDHSEAIVGGVYDAIVKDWEGLNTAFHQVFDEWMNAWGEGKETNEQIKKDWEDMTDNFISAMKEGMKWVKAAGEVAMDLKDVASGHAAGTTQANVAGDAMRFQASQVSASGKGDVDAFQTAATTYRARAEAAGQNMKAVDLDIAAQRHAFDGYEKIAESRRQMAQGNQWEELSKSLDAGHAGIHDSRKNQADAALQFTAQMALNSKEMREAIVHGEFHVREGIDGFIKMLSEKSPELARKLKELQNPLKESGGLKGGPVMNFMGDFHIHQDFRDQDPDRVVITFRRDLLGHIAARTQARTTTPFGL